jgi:methionine--tRNA ligase beta chain
LSGIKFKSTLFQLRFGLVSILVEIPFQDFQKLDLRVGEVVKAEQMAGSRNLIRMIVDFGFEKRQSVAGLLQYYKPDELIGNKFAFILNLQRKKFMGVESQCMMLAAEDEKGSVILLKPEKDIEVGSRIR